MLSINPDPQGAVVTYRRRGQSETEALKVARIVHCTGVYADPRRATNPVIRSLLSQGLAQSDGLGIGLDVGNDCAIISAGGQPSTRLFGVGPITRAAFWEILAVPDIRVQCAQLSEHLRTLLHDEVTGCP